MTENKPEDVMRAELRTSPGVPLRGSNSASYEGTLSRGEMERRRMEAVQEMLKGLPQSRVAIKFRVSRTTASRWHCALTTEGLESLRRRKATGRPSWLTPEQRAQIVDVFKQGDSASASSDHRWTATRLAKAIEDRFGVHYSRDHVGRLMHKLEMGMEDALPGLAAAGVAPSPVGILDSKHVPVFT